MRNVYKCARNLYQKQERTKLIKRFTFIFLCRHLFHVLAPLLFNTKEKLMIHNLNTRKEGM